VKHGKIRVNLCYGNTSSAITRYFTGQEFDKESGLYYMNARYYDPKIGVFTSSDPAMDGMNHYGYCSGNPIMYNDPTGLSGGYEPGNPDTYDSTGGGYTDGDSGDTDDDDDDGDYGGDNGGSGGGSSSSDYTVKDGDGLAEIVERWNQAHRTNYRWQDVAASNGILPYTKNGVDYADIDVGQTIIMFFPAVMRMFLFKSKFVGVFIKSPGFHRNDTVM
jgi:RHS repeat-associated protein